MKFRIMCERKTRAGWALDYVSLPGFGDSLILNGPNAEHVIANARGLGCEGRLVAVELDENDRPVARDRSAS